MLPRREKLEFPGDLSRAGKVWDSWEGFGAVLASSSLIHNLAGNCLGPRDGPGTSPYSGQLQVGKVQRGKLPCTHLAF